MAFEILEVFRKLEVIDKVGKKLDSGVNKTSAHLRILLISPESCHIPAFEDLSPFPYEYKIRRTLRSPASISHKTQALLGGWINNRA